MLVVTAPPFKMEGEVIEISRQLQPEHNIYKSNDLGDNWSLSGYDAIVISAMGIFDTYPGYYSGLKEGYIVDFDPNYSFLSSLTDSQIMWNRPLSKQIIDIININLYNSMEGFKFIRELALKFKGPIIVQPTPLPKLSSKENPDWFFNKVYLKPMMAYEFYINIKDNYLKNLCSEINASLLEYPSNINEIRFTPDDLMGDNSHGNYNYGPLVFFQIEKLIL